MDIFEKLRCQMGVQNISDLKQSDNLSQAIMFLAGSDLSEVPLTELSDAAHYFCGEKIIFSDYFQASAYFSQHCRKLP